MNSTNEETVIDEPTAEERERVLREAFAGLAQANTNRRVAAEAARPALQRLLESMRRKTDQGYTLRELLYSLYNGQAASVLELVTLDWSLRADLCAVLLGFGYENPRHPEESFYYEAMKAAIEQAGLWDWFIEAHKGEA